MRVGDKAGSERVFSGNGDKEIATVSWLSRELANDSVTDIPPDGIGEPSVRYVHR